MVRKSISIVACIAALTALSTGPVIAAEDPAKTATAFTTKIKVDPAQIGSKKLFLEFVNSPKLTEVMRVALRARGYSIVDTVDQSETQVKFTGAFKVEGKGLAPVQGKVEELVEASTTPQQGAVDYTYQYRHLDTIVVSALVLKVISITDIGVWLGETTGLAGRFNAMLTGDPRGICLINCENFNKFRNMVSIAAVGGATFQTLSLVYNEKIVVPQLIAEAIEELAKTFPVVIAATAAAGQPGESAEAKQ